MGVGGGERGGCGENSRGWPAQGQCLSVPENADLALPDLLALYRKAWIVYVQFLDF